MISFDTLGIIEIENNIITIGDHLQNEHRRIIKFILYEDYIYVCTELSQYVISSFPKFDIKADNVLKLDKKGNLIYRTGLLKLDNPVFEEKEFEASNLSIKDNQLYLGYGIG